jgi:hypothetical protein
MVNLSLYLIKHYAMKTYGEVDEQIHVFITSALVEDETSASRPGRFNPREKLPVPTGYKGKWATEPVWTI